MARVKDTAVVYGRVIDGLLEDVVRLGKVALDFGRVERITRHPDQGEPFPVPGPLETDTTHTVMLGLVACGLAERLYPTRLNIGRVAQYALVHDLVEVYAGDTNTLRMPTPASTAEKKAREEAAEVRLIEEFGVAFPWVTGHLSAYHDQVNREARFVRAVDKILPKITHLLNAARTIQEHGVTAEELRARYAAQGLEVARYAGEWPELLELRWAMVDRVVALVEQ